ncbi:WD repeat-containing protein 60 [Dinochytrium kinnereticum]|nr:WD repeat-containing protein 60 [Dinochytrium kinnereticum]
MSESKARQSHDTGAAAGIPQPQPQPNLKSKESPSLEQQRLKQQPQTSSQQKTAANPTSPQRAQGGLTGSKTNLSNAQQAKPSERSQGAPQSQSVQLPSKPSMQAPSPQSQQGKTPQLSSQMQQSQRTAASQAQQQSQLLQKQLQPPQELQSSAQQNSTRAASSQPTQSLKPQAATQPTPSSSVQQAPQIKPSDQQTQQGGPKQQPVPSLQAQSPKTPSTVIQAPSQPKPMQSQQSSQPTKHQQLPLQQTQSISKLQPTAKGSHQPSTQVQQSSKGATTNGRTAPGEVNASPLHIPTGAGRDGKPLEASAKDIVKGAVGKSGPNMPSAANAAEKMNPGANSSSLPRQQDSKRSGHAAQKNGHSQSYAKGYISNEDDDISMDFRDRASSSDESMVDEPVEEAYGDDEFEDYDEDFEAFEDEPSEPEPKHIIEDLKNLVEFDVAFYDIFELAPMNEYDLYIRSFGSLDSRQLLKFKVATQWNEDFVDTEVQTEDWYIADKWTQAPPDQLIDSGVGKPDLPWLQSEHEMWKRAEKKNEFNKTTAITALDSLSLIKFLRNASQVMDILLEENTLHATESIRVDNTSYINISQGQTRITLPSFLSGRTLIKLAFSPIDHRLLMTLWSQASGVFAESKIGKKGLICMWRLTDLTSPSCILLCEGDPSTICASHTKPYIYIAGTKEGGISAWDLREPSSLHMTLTEAPLTNESKGKTEYLLRRPCYTTDALFTMDQLHKEPVVLVYPLVNAGIDTETGGDGMGGFGANREEGGFNAMKSLQIVSMDAGGSLRLWVVSESRYKDYNSVAENDLGMGIGSSIRLVKGSGFALKSIDRLPNPSPGIHVTTCRFTPDNVSTFIVGTHTGDILHESRFRETCYPRLFDQNYNPAPLKILSHSSSKSDETPTKTDKHYGESSNWRVEVVVDPVTSLEYSPHHPNLFLAGYASGIIVLFHTSRSTPLVRWSLEWIANEEARGTWGSKPSKSSTPSRKSPSVIQACWSPHRPSVFYVLDDASTIYVWDLVEQSHEPTHVVPVGSYLSSSGDGTGPLPESARILFFALSPSPPGTIVPRRIVLPEHEKKHKKEQGMQTNETEEEVVSQQPSRSANGMGASLILAFGDGEIEAHIVSDELVEPAVDEMALFEAYVKSL